jgi:hypothetical protein
VSKPETQFKIVDFPDPDAPKSMVIPEAALNETSKLKRPKPFLAETSKPFCVVIVPAP